jgi:hypothetical protein
MRDTTKRPATPQFHITTDIQEQARPSEVLDKVLETTVEIPVFQLLGSSPVLQKLLNEKTKTKEANSYSYKAPPVEIR